MTPLEEAIVEHDKKIRNETLEAAAAICERMRPFGGRAFTEEQSACFSALTDAAVNIRMLKK